MLASLCPAPAFVGIWWVMPLLLWRLCPHVYTLPVCVCLCCCRSHLLYYMVVVAKQDIPAFTELTYSYASQVRHMILGMS
jgi:hypothetical protein